jgi:hypothetical protein
MNSKPLEKDLCEYFIVCAQQHHWECYPEVSEFDLLLKRGELTLGISAKLQLNLKVINQAVDAKEGVDFRAILCQPPKESYKFLEDLQLWTFFPIGFSQWFNDKNLAISSPYPVHFIGESMLENPLEFERYFHPHAGKVWLPEHIPQGPSGVKSPRKYSQWKDNFIRLVAIASLKEFIYTKDIQELSLKTCTLLRLGWIKKIKKEGTQFAYLLIEGIKNRPDRSHPDMLEKYIKYYREKLNF